MGSSNRQQYTSHSSGSYQVEEEFTKRWVIAGDLLFVLQGAIKRFLIATAQRCNYRLNQAQCATETA